MKFYTLDQLRLPHIEAANGVVVGNAGRRFVVLFIDDCGEVVGHIEIECPEEGESWHYFKRQYIDTCRALGKKRWKTARSIDSLYLYICDL